MSITSRLSDILQPDKRRGWQTSRRQACSDTPYLQFGSTTEGLYQTATFDGQDVQRKKPEAGTVPDRLQGSSCHTHARQTGKRQKTEASSFRKTPPGQCSCLV